MGVELDDISAAAYQLTQARQHLVELVVQAASSGVPQTEIAEAAGVSRQTVHRWLSSQALAVRVDVREVLNDALELLSTLLGTDSANTPTVRKRIGHSNIGTQVRGVEIGLKSLDVPPGQLTDGERLVLTTGSRVADVATRIHAQKGYWPDTVQIGTDD